MRAYLSPSAALVVCVLLAGCGSGSNANAPADSNSGPIEQPGSPSSGIVQGPMVAGLGVGSGRTDASGGFDYLVGETLNFSLGGQPLGSVVGRRRLSLHDIVGSADQYRFDKGVRLGQLLFSLDSDARAANGVQLDDSPITAPELQWQWSASVWRASAQSLVYRLSEGANSLLDADTARALMSEQLRAQTEQCTAAYTTHNGFNIADPRCSDRARLQIWREHMAAHLPQLQAQLEQFLDQRLSLQQWWAELESQWRQLRGNTEQSQAWISYLLAGADVPTRQAIADALDSGLNASAEAELERWRDGGANALRARDASERQLMQAVMQAWLSYGFDQQALRQAYALSGDDDWQALIDEVANREGIALQQLRPAVVDQQVYLGLQLIDALLQSADSWVSGGAVVSADDDLNAQPARVWRVSYETLLSGSEVEFLVEGSALDAQVQLLLNGCEDTRMLSGDSASRVFSCRLSGAAGGRSLQVLDGADGSLLYEAIVRVSGDTPVDDGAAQVSGVTPLKALRGSSQLFTVSGQQLPLDASFELAGCQNSQLQSRSSTELKVLCQLDDRATVRAGSIVDASGTELYAFSVSPLVLEEALMRVLDLAPAAALEGENLELVLSGSGFDAAVRVQSAACESTQVLAVSDIELRFSCNNAKLGTWPVYLLSQQQSVLAPVSLQVRAIEAMVSAVSPLSGREGEWLNIQVAGQQLSSQVLLDLDGCSAIESLDSNAVLRQFGCIPGAAGSYQGKVLAGGEVLYRFDFLVEPASATQVSGVSPTSSPYGEALQLRFVGTELPELARLQLPNCANIALLSASDSAMVFSCTPQQVGELAGNLVGPQGDELLSFKVQIVDTSNPVEAIEITGLTPDSAYLDLQTTFTVTGERLPVTLRLTMEGCTEVAVLGGHDRQRQFRCTPRGVSGTRQVKLYASEGGALLGSFDLQVTGNELLVQAVSPTRTAIGVSTVFRVSGQNLSSAMVLELDGCDARLQSSSSTEQRSYRCTPYGLAGTRQIRVLDRLGGAVLYQGTVEILAAT